MLGCKENSMPLLCQLSYQKEIAGNSRNVKNLVKLFLSEIVIHPEPETDMAAPFAVSTLEVAEVGRSLSKWPLSLLM